MQILLNEDGYVANFATLGGIVGGIEYDDDPPESFQQKHFAYKFMGGDLVFDEEHYLQLTQQSQFERDVAVEWAELENWLERYDRQALRYNNLGKDSGVDMETLNAEAKVKLTRLRELRQIQEGF